MNYIQKLIEISSEPFVSGEDTKLTTNNDLNKILKIKDGFFAFESALRVFPTSDCEKSFSLNSWNSKNLWKGFYNNLTDNCYFFAEDIFGNQFCYFEDKIHSFDAETGDKVYIADNIDAWCKKVLEDYNLLTGCNLAHEWQSKNGRIEYKKRLIPIKPFIFGGDYSVDNLKSVDSINGMISRGPIAESVNGIEDGKSVKLNITN